jgi:ribonuclease P protein component
LGARVLVPHADFKVETAVVERKAASMERLKRRTDFRAAAQAARAPAGAFVLQARRRDEERAEGGTEGRQVRVGFTVSRQVGNAVERNRVRRRLREMVRLMPAAALRAGHDYVLIGRRTALAAPFGDMVRQLDAALRRIHAGIRNGQEGKAAATGAGGEAPPHTAGPPAKRPGNRRPRQSLRKQQRKST